VANTAEQSYPVAEASPNSPKRSGQLQEHQTHTPRIQDPIVTGRQQQFASRWPEQLKTPDQGQMGKKERKEKKRKEKKKKKEKKDLHCVLPPDVYIFGYKPSSRSHHQLQRISCSA